MISTNMRYKGFEWSHNPKKLRIRNGKKTVDIIYPFSYVNAREAFRQGCVISGEGELYGEDCIKQFNRLNRLFAQRGEGVLCVSGMPSVKAYFTRLELLCEPAENVISYAFEFEESSTEEKKNTGVSYHIVKDGETLWDIAYLYGVTVEELLLLNLQIRRPDSIREGERISIC